MCNFQVVHVYFFILVECEQDCYNGGTCTPPGICTCENGWTGKDCNTGMY